MLYRRPQFLYSLSFRTVHCLRLRSNIMVHAGLILGKVIRKRQKMNNKQSILCHSFPGLTWASLCTNLIAMFSLFWNRIISNSQVSSLDLSDTLLRTQVNSSPVHSNAKEFKLVMRWFLKSWEYKSTKTGEVKIHLSGHLYALVWLLVLYKTPAISWTQATSWST